MAKRPAHCPIPGCTKVFQRGTLGWHTHVGQFANHPKWRPDLPGIQERRDAFQNEFPDFFSAASSADRRQAPSDRRPRSATDRAANTSFRRRTIPPPFSSEGRATRAATPAAKAAPAVEVPRAGASPNEDLMRPLQGGDILPALAPTKPAEVRERTAEWHFCPRCGYRL